METKVQGIDARAYLIGWLNALNGMYAADVNAIPDDKLCVSMGGVSRPANELTIDAIQMLEWTADAVNGNVRTDLNEDSAKERAVTLNDKASLNAAMAAAVDSLSKAIASASDETMNTIVTPPWKIDAPLYLLCLIATSHVWYHDGQLNYIQSLNGDGEVHWMG